MALPASVLGPLRTEREGARDRGRERERSAVDDQVISLGSRSRQVNCTPHTQVLAHEVD